MRIEKKNICKKCGGKCCKRSGCDYFVSDFSELTEEALIRVLDEGNISIVGAIKPVPDRDGYLTLEPYLYLRARNLGRDIIDLFSFKHQCMLLTDEGCPYPVEKRPGGGADLIPRKFGHCYRKEDPMIEAMKWEPYQELLAGLVERYSGMTITECFRRDIEQVLFEVLTEQFDGVAKEELADMLQSVPLVVSCFPELYISARERAIEELSKKSIVPLMKSKTLNQNNN